MINNCCKGGVDKHIRLYKWRHTIQQKKNHFEHESNLWSEYYNQGAAALQNMSCFKIYSEDIIELYIYESKANVEPRKELIHSTKFKYGDIIQMT